MQNGILTDPRKQFGVFVFCDDASGTSIGVIKISPGEGVYDRNNEFIENEWKLEDRFWQDAQWARDVDKIEWSKDGLELRVFTSSVYGTGKSYKLDLVKKKAYQLP